MWKPAANPPNLPPGLPLRDTVFGHLTPDQTAMVNSALTLATPRFADVFIKRFSDLLVTDGGGPFWSDSAVAINATDVLWQLRDQQGVVLAFPFIRLTNPARAALAPAAALTAAATVTGP